MASKFIHAVNVNADTNLNYYTKLTNEFWKTYETKLEHCSFTREKKIQMISNIKETASRLVDSDVEPSLTRCTWWEHDCLCFKPSAIDTSRIREEQNSSFRIMYSNPEHCRIRVLIDLSETTWSFALRTTNAARFESIVDGLRLWTCLPHSIDRISIIKPNSSMFNTLFQLVVQRAVSVKLLNRMRVYSSVNEMLNADKHGE